jgi:NADPH:quinone reductase-like Zn-dependent oxidoreductase
VVATTSSDEKAERLRALGADDVINYQACPAWPKRVIEGAGGADHVVDVVGRLDQSVDALAMGGEIAYVGLLDRDRGLPPIPPERLRAKACACG